MRGQPLSDVGENTSLKYMLLGLVLSILVILIFFQLKSYTFLLYKLNPKPQFLDVEFDENNDINDLVLISIEDVHKICDCQNCFGCRLHYVIGKENIKIEKNG